MGTTYYKKGDHNGICDSCGFKYKFSELKKQWDGIYSCKKCWDYRHPQEFIKGKIDDQSVEDSRPRGDFEFVDTSKRPDI